MGRIGIEMVEPGMVLAEDLINSNGRFLLGKGAKLDPSHLRVLLRQPIHRGYGESRLLRQPIGRPAPLFQ